MSRQYAEIRNTLVQQFNAALDSGGGCTQHQREAARYERGGRVGAAGRAPLH